MVRPYSFHIDAPRRNVDDHFRACGLMPYKGIMSNHHPLMRSAIKALCLGVFEKLLAVTESYDLTIDATYWPFRLLGFAGLRVRRDAVALCVKLVIFCVFALVQFKCF